VLEPADRDAGGTVVTAPLLEVSGLGKSFDVPGPGGGRRRLRAVEDMSFSVAGGETFALVGESGSGKTTVGRLVLRLIEPDTGRVVFAGTDLRSLDGAGLRAMRRRMQIVFQDPFASLDPRERIGEAISAPIRLHRLRSSTHLRARVEELLDLVGLDVAVASRFPHALSGGQRQRVVIARALAVEPELLVCDEPVAALDVSVQAQILNLLQDLRARLGLTMIFVSHDMGVVRSIAHSVGVMYAGRLVETGPAAEIFGRPRHPYTQALLASVPAVSPAARRVKSVLQGEPPDPFAAASGCRFAERCPHAADPCRSAPPVMRSLKDTSHLALCHRLEDLPPNVSPWIDGAAALSPVVSARLDALRARRAECGP
jgi:oligopeptide/dipeptide ABC transporter ATP-binding protein